MIGDIRQERIAIGGIRLNVAQAGPPDGRLLILLHGFPEFWYGWKKHLPALAAAGFRVVAPDQRGYNTSDKPPRVRDYALDLLAGDVVGLIDALGGERAIVVGHDWGGAVAWWLAHNYPQRVERLAIVNVPHPLVLRRLLWTSPRQLLKSWYMFLLQLPWLPEWAGQRANWQSMVEGMRSSSLPGTFSEEDFEEYRRAWSQPGAYPAMLNWYRAMFRHGARRPKHARIAVPTLVLWGAQDRFIGRAGAEQSLQLCERGELVMFEENTHWLQHERPDEVCRRIIEFCG